MTHRIFAFSLAVIFFAAVPALRAQTLTLKNGTRIAAKALTFADGKLTQNITLSNGTQGQASVLFTDIDHMDWGMPSEVLEAQSLLAAGKVKEALAVLSKAKVFFVQFKNVKGNPYEEVVFAQLNALDQAGDFDALLKIMPEVNAIKWDDEKKLQLRIVKLNMERRTSSDQEKILSDAETILASTDDSAVSARLWITVGDVHYKKERWDKAFDAFLHVPVFYGSQGALVPQSELMAARCLTQMERFKDAAAMFTLIAEGYKGSEIGETAKKEFLSVNGRENKADKPQSGGKDAPKKADEKKS